MSRFLVLVLLFALPALAHEEAGGYDVHFSPGSAFMGDATLLAADISDGGKPVSGTAVDFVVDQHDRGISERLRAQERSAGSFVARYAFSSPGSYEVHVEAGETRRTFSVAVAGTDAGSVALILALLAGCVATLYVMRTGRMRNAGIALLLVLVLIGLGYSLHELYASGAAQRGVTVCVSPSECYWSAHIHASVDVTACGAGLRFPVEKGPLSGPHTHEEKNLIHFHERLRLNDAGAVVDATPLRLGAFFDAMNVTFDKDRILDKRNGDSCREASVLKMTVNGKPRDTFRDYVWKDGDKIALVFDESPAQAAVADDEAALQAPELTLPIIIGFALIDSINPCVIGVLILLLTVLVRAKKRRTMLANGSVYVLGVYITYLIGGITLLSVFNAVRDVQQLSQLFYLLMGGVVIIAGMIEIKDFFWYGHGFTLSIPARFVKTMERKAQDTHASLLSAFTFGALVTLVELPCTGAPYLAIITMLSQSGTQFYSALALLLLYNLVFVLPLLVIIFLAYRGVGYKRMEHWRREHRGTMRLVIGILLMALGIWIVATVAEHLLVPLIGGSIIMIGAMAALWRLRPHRH